MSDLHCRGCDCLECCPGFKAQATRVYSTRAMVFPLPLKTAEREKKNRRERNRLRTMKWRARKELGL